MLIEYSNVNINQLSQQVLRNINLQINEGELVYITGKVGTGKSSFVKTLYGELDIEGGNARVLEFDMHKIKQSQIPQLRRKIGIIFQDFQLLTDRCVEDNLRFVLKATGWKKAHEINNRINEVLEMVGMGTKGYKFPHELSGGEQQRIAIARAILNSPQLILADEPTANLDEDTGRQIAELLTEICKKGTAVIIITHNMELLRLYPGRIFQCKDHMLTETTISNTEEETDNTQ